MQKFIFATALFVAIVTYIFIIASASIAVECRNKEGDGYDSRTQFLAGVLGVCIVMIIICAVTLFFVLRM